MYVCMYMSMHIIWLFFVVSLVKIVQPPSDYKGHVQWLMYSLSVYSRTAVTIASSLGA